MSITIHSLNKHSGIESLSVGERLLLWGSEINTGLTAINVKHFTRSVHTVSPNTIFNKLKEKNNYFQLSQDFIPAPTFFDPNKSSFRDYVKICISVTGMLNVTTDIVNDMYKSLKTAANTNSVPFKLRNANQEILISDVATKLDSVFQNTGKATRQLSTLYPSFTDAEDTFKLYNDNIKNLSARDPELLVKYVGNLTELVKVFKHKIDTNDIIIGKEELDTLEIALKRVDTVVQYCGRLISLCNELTRVFELQLTYFKQKIN